MYAKEEFISRIHEQIAAEEKYSHLLEEGKCKLSHSRWYILIPAVILTVGFIWQVSLKNNLPGALLMIWIAASFLLYMVYFFLMMIPSFGSDADIKIFDKSMQENIRNFLRLATILKTFNKNKITLIEFFWNAFIINTKPLIKGFSILYSLDLLCALILLVTGEIELMTFGILCGQIAVIFLMYYKVWKAKPGTPGFFTGSGLPDERMPIKKGIIVWLSAGLFGIVTGVVLLGAMMFPGLTLEGYLQNITLIPTEYPVFLALVLLTQGLWLRYVQGCESRVLMGTLNEHHLAVLRTDLLPAAEAAAPEDIVPLKRRFILLSMNKLIVQEFFCRFPAYALMPNVLVVTDPAAQEILNDASGEDKKLKDLL
ncbi:MAG: hypothetical protein Q4Q04_01510 [Methanocorpusculum sp.]|nr:hypothetical protein [Methanocorpusculum sp.]